MSKYVSLLLLLAAIIPGAAADFGDTPPIIYIGIGIFLFFFLLSICTVINCWYHPNSHQRQMMRLQKRTMEAQIHHLENAPPGTVHPIYNFGGGHMHNEMLANPQLMVSSGIPGQHMASYNMMASASAPFEPTGMSMPSA